MTGSMFAPIRLCEIDEGGCGSGKTTYPTYDARGIYLCRVCEKCEKEKLGGYRPEVLSDSNYECDEIIDEE